MASTDRPGPPAPLDELAGLGIEASGLLAVAVDPDAGLGLATTTGGQSLTVPAPLAALAEIDERWSPRWVWWDRSTADQLAAASVAVDRCWDVVAVHRLLVGRFRLDAGLVWADLHGLDPGAMPTMGQLDLLSTADEGSDPDDPIRPDGYLRPEWLAGAWRASPARRTRWAELAIEAATAQLGLMASRPDAERVRSTANAESVAELLCAELAHHGLPVDEADATRIIVDIAGPRPVTLADEEREQRRRDADVLRHLDPSPGPGSVNLRNPADVRSMLRRSGFDLPDTRAWRLERLRDTSPLIDALLTWRKAERIATTYGHGWLDEHVSGGRLRGSWSSSDGAAGRMTASAGLHNLPAPMRPAVAAEPGHRLVRADLGQIEPRVLAAVSGDRELIAATADDDLYQPVAQRLGVERDVAKVAVLAAMYGATTGESAGALRGLQQSYPVAMAMLEEAARQGQLGHDVTTIGGRRVRMGGGSAPDGDIDAARSAAAARGRYARNALIQGAAAEFFKVWAIIVRRRTRADGARVVLCLHDELLVHAPTTTAAAVAEAVADAVDEAAFYWSPEPGVRFVADTSVIDRWSDAKG